jgi:hypothetical protein
VIHHENGKETTINPCGIGTPMHFDESGSDHMRHLTPRTTGVHTEMFNDMTARGEMSCLYRAYMFHKLGRNGTAEELAKVREDVAQRFEANPLEQLNLYIHSKPKRVWGGSNKKNQKSKHKGSAKPNQICPSKATKPDFIRIGDSGYGATVDETTAVAKQKPSNFKMVKDLDDIRVVNLMMDQTPSEEGDNTMLHVMKEGIVKANGKRPKNGFRLDAKYINKSRFGTSGNWNFNLQINGQKGKHEMTTFASVIAPGSFMKSNDGIRIILQHLVKSAVVDGTGHGVTYHLTEL